VCGVASCTGARLLGDMQTARGCPAGRSDDVVGVVDMVPVAQIGGTYVRL
jgi:hypothetical protein